MQLKSCAYFLIAGLSEKTLSPLQAVPMVSFRSGKLWTEPLWLAEGESRVESRRAKGRPMGDGKDGKGRSKTHGTTTVEWPPSSRAGCPCYGGAVTTGAMAGTRKKECLFLTNKAVMLLKRKDRENERSRTKPIKSTKLLKTNENGYEQSRYVVENKVTTNS